MKKSTVRDIKNLAGKTVVLTVDFNISLKDGKVANDTRIVEVLPTISFLFSKSVKKLILISHLGRPEGYDPKYSLKPVAESLSSYLKQPILLLDRFWDKDANVRIQQSKEKVILLENIRFHEGEKNNDLEFARHLASFGDIFVNDAFGASHRIHASTVGIARFLPSFAGLLMDKEVKMLSCALENPKRPFVLIIGGAKTPEKVAVIDKLLDIADTVALGGAVANTFLAAWGFGMGQSAVDYEMIEMSRVVFWKASRKHSALILPTDVIVSNQDRTQKPVLYKYNEVPNDVSIYDIGTKTQKLYASFIQEAKTVIWNGPMGLFEDKRFASGTQSILQNITRSKCFSIVGGGDTLTSLTSKTLLNKISHVSTGGSAMLEYLEKGNLPGLEVLQDG